MTDLGVTMATLTLAAATGGVWYSGWQVGRIEQRRAHHEQTPELSIEFVRPTANPQAPMLEIGFRGPFNEPIVITPEIRSNRPDGAEAVYTAGGPTAEEVRRQIYGPWQFKPGVNGAGHNGQTRNPATIEPGGFTVMSLVPTTAPMWASDHDRPSWFSMHGSELRLTLTVERSRKIGWRRRPEQWVMWRVLPAPSFKEG